jgi:hypothetical protein
MPAPRGEKAARPLFFFRKQNVIPAQAGIQT